jgi:hypothetical protein
MMHAMAARVAVSATVALLVQVSARVLGITEARVITVVALRQTAQAVAAVVRMPRVEMPRAITVALAAMGSIFPLLTALSVARPVFLAAVVPELTLVTQTPNRVEPAAAVVQVIRAPTGQRILVAVVAHRAPRVTPALGDRVSSSFKFAQHKQRKENNNGSCGHLNFIILYNKHS